MERISSALKRSPQSLLRIRRNALRIRKDKVCLQQTQNSSEGVFISISYVSLSLWEGKYLPPDDIFIGLL